MSAKLEEYPPSMTLADFLAWERQQPNRHEFVNGEVWMMHGGTLNHNRIARNVTGGLNAKLGHRGCEAFQENVKVLAAGCVYYPDVAFTCAPQDGRGDILDAPSLIVEVLSPSTEHVDRLRKWQHYQTVGSLAAYLQVQQDAARVDAFIRRGEEWIYKGFSGLGAIIEVPDLGLSLPLAEIYRGVGFDEPEARSA